MSNTDTNHTMRVDTSRDFDPANCSSREERTDLPWRIVLAVLLVALILSVADLLVPTVAVLLVLFGGVPCGIFFNGITRWVQHFLPLSYRWTYTLIVALLLTGIAAGVFYMGSQVATQVSELSNELDAAGSRLQGLLEEYTWAKPYLPERSQVGDAVSGGLVPTVMYGLQTSISAITALAVVLGVGLYLAYDPELYTEGMTRLIPQAHRERFRRLLKKINSTLGYWIVGRLLSMSLVGIMTAIGLWLLGVPLPITLGVLAALLTFIPNIGPILAAVPQALLALQVDVNTVLYVLLFNVVLQTVESYVITPLIQQYEVMLPPVLTISAQVLLGTLFGIVGIVMAAPLTGATMVAVQLLYVRGYLNDRQPGDLVESG